MIDLHEKNTEKKVEPAVADSKYGTIDSFLLCHDLNIKTRMPSIEETHRGQADSNTAFNATFEINAPAQKMVAL